MRRRLVTLLAVLIATGCGTVPTSGPVRSSNQGGSQLDHCQVDIDAQPPQPGASAEQIVNGFLEAMGDSSTFDVARQYLTEDAAGKWRPERQMVVYDDPPNRPALGQAPNGNLRLDATKIATVNARGSWRPVAPRDRELRFDFDLDQVNGEWRIAEAPKDSVYIKANLLEINYAPVNLYFFTPALDRLIPDPVYLPQYCSPGQRATRLVEALLAGPTDRLGNSVPNLVPQDTKVNVSVPVDASSVATVALNEPPSKLGPDLRKRLAAQIAWTLPTRSVRLTANGAPLVDGGQEEVSRADFDEFNPVPSGSSADRLFVPPPSRNSKGIWQVNGLDGTVQPDRSLVVGQLSDELVESFAVELRGQRAAVVRPDGKGLVIGQLLGAGEAGKRYVETQGLVLRPSFDAQGNLWIVDRADQPTARIRRVGPEAKEEPKTITAIGLVPQRIRVLRVAPDGVRVLLVVGDDLRRQVTIGRLTSTGTPTQLNLEGFSPLHLRFSDVVDAGWSEPDKITVLGTGSRSEVGQNQPLEANVDGSVQRPVLGRERFNLTDLAVSPVTASLLVVRDEDRVLHAQSKELSWNQLLTTGQPVYPG